jgi:hypothetical protein
MPLFAVSGADFCPFAGISHQIKTVIMIGMIGLHPEKGGFCAECDLNH